MWNRLRTAGMALACASSLKGPVPLMAADWDIGRVGRNFELVSLDTAELARRNITLTALGDVELPSGRIVVTDPLAQPGRPPLERAVPPGDYKVTIYEAFDRVAAASLRFAEGKPVRWELALLPGQTISDLKDDLFLGYGVDAGTGAFMDAGTLALMDERLATEKKTQGGDVDYYNTVLARDYPGDVNALMHRPVEGKRGNIAVFSSGWGDGVYPAFWGLSSDGRPLVLLTDFFVIRDSDGRKEATSE